MLSHFSAASAYSDGGSGRKTQTRRFESSELDGWRRGKQRGLFAAGVFCVLEWRQVRYLNAQFVEFASASSPQYGCVLRFPVHFACVLAHQRPGYSPHRAVQQAPLWKMKMQPFGWTLIPRPWQIPAAQFRVRFASCQFWNNRSPIERESTRTKPDSTEGVIAITGSASRMTWRFTRCKKRNFAWTVVSGLPTIKHSVWDRHLSLPCCASL